MRKSFQSPATHNTSFTGPAIRIGIIAFACLFLSATGALADAVYTYTGSDFTSVSGSYTTSDKVTGTIVLSAPLPANLVSVTDESSLLVSYSFSDGIQSLTQTNSAPAIFDFGTSNTGAIVEWQISMNNPPNFTLAIGTSNLGQGAEDFAFTPDGSNAQSFVAGTWSAGVSVPEPGTLTMMLSGLVGLGLLAGMKRCRRNRLATET